MHPRCIEGGDATDRRSSEYPDPSGQGKDGSRATWTAGD